MKKFKYLIAVLLAVTLVLCGCGTGGGTTGNGGGNGLNIDLGDKDNPTYAFVEDGELAASSVSKSDSIYKLQATDDYGRSVDYICGYKTDKARYVGLFYFLWLGAHGSEMDGVYDISKLLDEDPDALWDTNGKKNSPIGKYHFWGEPLYGYYHSEDPWVIRKQLELFIAAGIDFLCFDCTNGSEYMSVLNVLLPIMEEYRLAGWNVPKFMFYTNSNSASVVYRLYAGGSSATGNPMELNGIYKGGYYKELWFAPNGKPKIAAIIDESHNTSEINAANSVIKAGSVVSPTKTLSAAEASEILGFFDFWESQWPNSTHLDNGLPWIDWNRPQLTHTTGDVINVSVAQHNMLPFSDALLSGELADLMYGRGYSNGSADHSDDAIIRGDNFEEQWGVALERDLGYTFVTGWNEWVAIKSAMAGMNSQYVGTKKRVYFVDTVNQEYSRDIEMMKGGYQDNPFLSLMRNTRKYKGDSSTAMAASAKGTVDITKGLTQWNSVSDVYYGMKSVNRDFKDFTGKGKYTDTSMRNDIEEIRVTHDDDYVYFLVKCYDDIEVAAESANWMNILIDVEGYANNNSFYGYDFVINRKSSYTGQCSVEKISYGGSEITYEMTAKAQFTLGGKYMQYRIPKSALGIKGTFKLNFKIADNVTDPENIESYYISGDCAPVGRLNFTFKG